MEILALAWELLTGPWPFTPPETVGYVIGMSALIYVNVRLPWSTK